MCIVIYIYICLLIGPPGETECGTSTARAFPLLAHGSSRGGNGDVEIGNGHARRYDAVRRRYNLVRCPSISSRNALGKGLDTMRLGPRDITTSAEKVECTENML